MRVLEQCVGQFCLVKQSEGKTLSIIELRETERLFQSDIFSVKTCFVLG